MIKKRQEIKTKNIDPSKIIIKNYNYPIFCFKHLHKDYHLDKCISQEKQSFIEQIIYISQFSWQTLQSSPRHGIGCEKININSLKSELPNSIKFTEDINHLLAFRFYNKMPFIGYRNGFIFHVIFIDREFKLYKH